MGSAAAAAALVLSSLAPWMPTMVHVTLGTADRMRCAVRSRLAHQVSLISVSFSFLLDSFRWRVFVSSGTAAIFYQLQFQFNFSFVFAFLQANTCITASKDTVSLSSSASNVLRGDTVLPQGYALPLALACVLRAIIARRVQSPTLLSPAVVRSSTAPQAHQDRSQLLLVGLL